MDCSIFCSLLHLCAFFQHCHMRAERLLPPATKLGQGYVFTRICDSVQRGWYPNMPFRWYPSMPCRSLRGGIPACLAGGIQAFLAGLQGVSRPTSRWVSRPTPKGGLQAHTQGGSPGSHLGGGIPACTESDPSTATAVGGTHPTGMHSC